LERASIALLSAAAVFELVTGLLDITYWYGAMPFAFIAAHYWVGWTAIGALVLHIAVKLPVIRRALGEKSQPAAGPSRRAALGLVGTAAAVITVLTVGQTVRPLRRLALLAPRLPDVGPQGIPVNRTAAAAQVTRVADDYRLVVSGPGGRHAFTLADLAALPQHTVSLPISCVEGWSAGARWTGIRVADLLTLVGGDDRQVRIDSMERGGAYRSSILEAGQARDPLTLLALRLNGVVLHPDHGYPLRLIAPNRPGVLQTKWVNAMTVVSR
jgi:DMSO/TMAO reductase YedYZ molybdopterin-dependent catalytic subunit